MKKVLLSLALVLSFALTAVSFADAGSYNAGYTTPVKHEFVTSYGVTKSSSEVWGIIKDENEQIRYKNMSTCTIITNGCYQKTCASKANGTMLSSYNDVYSGVPKSIIGRYSGINGEQELHLKIHNPNYDEVSHSATLRLQTKGSIHITSVTPSK